MLVAIIRGTGLQELTLAGAHVRTIGAGIIAGHVSSIDVRADILLMGARRAGDLVLLFSLASGSLIRSFGRAGLAQGLLSPIHSSRFTPDGRHVLLVEYSRERLSLFTVSGEFVRCIGLGVLVGPMDALFTSSGDLVVADSVNKRRLFVFSPDGSKLLRSFGGKSTGGDDGDVGSPDALAMHADQLYVLDNATPRVLVYN